MCRVCEEGRPQNHFASRRKFLKGTAAIGATAVGLDLFAGNAAEIDARGRIVMPGFIDTHHHQFETALRSFLADGILIKDNSNTPSGDTTYFEFILQQFA